MAAIKTFFTLILVALTQLKEQPGGSQQRHPPLKFLQVETSEQQKQLGLLLQLYHRPQQQQQQLHGAKVIFKKGKRVRKKCPIAFSCVTVVTAVGLTLILVLNQVSSGLPASILFSGRRAQAIPPPVFIFNQASSVPHATGRELATA